jgi:hypothetical protein
MDLMGLVSHHGLREELMVIELTGTNLMLLSCTR